MELHPAAFVETGSCDGPRYIREQPSRSSNVQGSGPDAFGPGDYITEYSINVPYKNLLAYTKEIEDQWTQLTPEQKDVVSNSLSLFVMKNPESITGLNQILQDNNKLQNDLVRSLELNNKNIDNIEKFTSLKDVTEYYIKILSTNVQETLDTIYEGYNKEFLKWLFLRKYHNIDDTKIFIIIIVLILFILIGIGIGYNCTL